MKKMSIIGFDIQDMIVIITISIAKLVFDIEIMSIIYAGGAFVIVSSFVSFILIPDFEEYETRILAYNRIAITGANICVIAYTLYLIASVF